MRLSITALVLAGLASSGTAQGVAVFPGDHSTNGGLPVINGFSQTPSYPFSRGVSRVMYVYETWDLAIPDGSQITRVGFPRDESSVSFGESIQLRILMGHTQNDASNASGSFATNYENPPVEVFSTKIFALPDLGNVLTPPPNEEVWVPLDVPFTLDKTRNLVVEYQVLANSNGNAAFNYRLDLGQYSSPVQAIGQGCPTSGGTIPLLASQRTPIGGTWRVSLTRATASANVLLGIAPSPLPVAFPWPGAPGCDLWVAGLFWIPNTTNTGGNVTWSFPVPYDLTFYQAHLYTQALITDLFANPSGFVLSNADDIQLGVQTVSTMIIATGSATATSGSVLRNWGQLALFDWQ